MSKEHAGVDEWRGAAECADGGGVAVTHTFLDNDKAGIAASNDAQANGLLAIADCHMANCPGMAESELEDLFDVSKYESLIQTNFGVTLNSSKFKNSKKKWSDRIKDTFLHQGKAWSEKVEMDLKKQIAQQLASSPEGAIQAIKAGSIEALINALEQKLST